MAFTPVLHPVMSVPFRSAWFEPDFNRFGAILFDTISSQSAVVSEELSAFEKKEYGLLFGAVPTPNEADFSQQRTEVRGQKTEGGNRAAGENARLPVLINGPGLFVALDGLFGLLPSE
jgi:hypothetical protein